MDGTQNLMVSRSEKSVWDKPSLSTSLSASGSASRSRRGRMRSSQRGSHQFGSPTNAIVDGSSDDIVYSSLFTGVHGNYLKASIRASGLDPDKLPESDPSAMNFGGDGAKKAWKDIWGCGQGIGAVDKVVPTRELVARLAREYEAARRQLLAA